MRLTNEMHDAVAKSDIGKFISRLIEEEVARGGDTKLPPNGGGNVIQRLWAAFMAGRK